MLFPSLEKFATVCCDPTVKGFGIVNKEEVDVFLELSCFSDYGKAFDWVDHNKLENS